MHYEAGCRGAPAEPFVHNFLLICYYDTLKEFKAQVAVRSGLSSHRQRVRMRQVMLISIHISVINGLISVFYYCLTKGNKVYINKCNCTYIYNFFHLKNKRRTGFIFLRLVYSENIVALISYFVSFLLQCYWYLYLIVENV